jgi:hypothetical protein
MTAPECLNASPAAIHPSRRRAPARKAEVRSNSDNDRHEPCPKIQNGSALNYGTDVCAPRTAPSRPCSTLQVICRPLKSHN